MDRPPAKVSLRSPLASRTVYAPAFEYGESLQSSVDYLLSQANHQLTSDELDGWKFSSFSKGVRIYRSESLVDPVVRVKGRAVVLAPPAKLIEAMWQRPRPEWDVLCKSSTSVEEVDENTVIHHDHYEAVRCFIRVPRDVVYIARTYETEQGGFIVTACGVDHPKCPEQEGFVRLKLFPSGWIIQPTTVLSPSGETTQASDVTYILQVDVKLAYVPSSFIGQVAATAPLCIYRVAQLVSRQATKRSDARAQSVSKKESRLNDLAACFEDDDQLMTYTLRRLNERNPEAFARALQQVQSSKLHLSTSAEIVTSDDEDAAGAGTSSKPPPRLLIGTSSLQGSRKTFEDTFKVAELQDENGGNTLHFAGVFDGHYGDFAALYCRDCFHRELFRTFAETKDMLKATEATFSDIEKSFLEVADKQQNESGSTAVVVAIHGWHMVVGNVGDSMAVLCRSGKAIVLTELHGPVNPQEVKRVTKAGGTFHGNRKLCHPVWNPSMINLGVTRAIGDLFFKKPEYTEQKATGLTATPWLQEALLRDIDDFIVVATDGLWDVLSPQEVCDMALKSLTASPVDAVADQLARLAIQRNCDDNVTVILITLK
eukprot:TRINITY_DN10188_c0_g1_i1.p1 TRINITY_DN10188_c0_g1~~TRINITY_DN10188_c0_g1_i1.p1  ORF type:complete len:598 (-),score=153.41 TRINITY_DN10188_c0_g1_i1:377-2170(-)